jgi:hypothetical protein
MQRLSNLTIFLGRYPATRIAISTFSGQEHFNAALAKLGRREHLKRVF